MYNFVFYFVYIQNLEKNGNKTAIIIASILVYFLLLGQITCLYILLQYLYFNTTGSDLIGHKGNVHLSVFSNIIIGTTFVSLIFLIYKYYIKHIEAIQQKYHYQTKKDFSSKFNVIKFLLLFILPWIIIIAFG